MVQMRNEEENYLRAQKKVAKMKKFYQHLTSWIFTSIFLFVLFFFLRMPIWITFVVVAGWGIGIASEAIEVFGFPGVDRDWEERKIREEMERMNPDRDHERDDYDDNIFDHSEDDELELKPPQKVRRNWNESDFV